MTVTGCIPFYFCERRANMPEEKEYKSNSYKSKAQRTGELAANDIPETKIAKVDPKTPVKVRKKSGFAKFADDFIRDDLAKVKDFAINDVLIPAIKKSISDIFKTGIDMMLYHGEAGSRGRYSDNSRVSYRSYYDNGPSRRRTETYSSRNHDYRDSPDIQERIFETRGEAEAVLDNLYRMMARYHIVSVADYCDETGITGSYVDRDWGWTDISTARVERDRDGYYIKMPRALPIDNK